MTTYQKQTWVNDEAGETPIDADRLNYIENGIAASIQGIVLNLGQSVPGGLATGTVVIQKTA